MNSSDQFTLDFIGIGAPKCGTSWAAACVDEHPEACVSKPKELHFFNRRRFMLFSFEDRPDLWNYTKGMEWYKNHFTHCASAIIKGEWSTDYIYDSEAPELIKKHFPNIKLVLLLRNPVDQTYSQYLHKAEGRTYPPFEKLIKNDAYLASGLYYEYIKRYLTVFPREQIFIGIYEEMRKKPALFIKNLYTFLNINPSFIPPSLVLEVNPSAPKASTLKRSFTITSEHAMRNPIGRIIIRIMKFLHINNAIKRVLYNPIRRAVVTKSEKKTAYTPLTPDIRAQLSSYYAADIEKLASLLGKDLSAWKS
ncbi:MAG: hypothetical protein COU90_02015 [Candidatus Ryanbacteria bacterium CG10_big_fil_rev_8_21_14_0_10_43_42]|uniref:Sulfotransferase domain-containing protein n=1 Tax=Candidatus Ryanbacteria bacterium CG10_big_fil_rev_8_21_14_0_10_43_42 TaxID=1974864 RepID=A0A2M8KXI0_9BACT|nr:MAG: hypothetical protein COU90_02015 [Candidatus Ryanbacteria bacterium CG10_big_fil_rev_8_21_14_0_10_43_42]